MLRYLMTKGASGLCALVLAASVGSWLYQRHAYADGPWYVAPAGQNTNDCRSPATACRTISAAIDKAASGDTINIAAGIYHEVLVIQDKNVSLAGAGPASTIVDAEGAQPQPGNPRVVLGVFATVSLSGATLRNGVEGVYIGPNAALRLTNVDVAANRPGGGIANLGSLTATNATISGNQAAPEGGGLENILQGKALLSNVTISGNVARYRGAGIMNSAALTLTNVIVASNSITDTAGADTPGGGGIFNQGSLAVVNGIVANNTAPAQGGGLANLGTATLRQTTISGNRSSQDGGGVLNHWVGGTAVLTITNATISGNSASLAQGGVGGGIANGEATASLTNVTISGNTANLGGGIYTLGTARVKNTIIATSAAGGNCSVEQQSLVSLGHNLDSGSTCALAGAGDLENTNPLLGSLRSNGGFAPTHALLPASPAIDAGDNQGCPSVDQRGVIRPADGDGNGSQICDIGAYERVPGSDAYLPTVRK